MTDERPLLGLATTKELLSELEARMSFEPEGSAGELLGAQCHWSLGALSPELLAYRTVNAT